MKLFKAGTALQMIYMCAGSADLLLAFGGVFFC